MANVNHEIIVNSHQLFLLSDFTPLP